MVFIREHIDPIYAGLGNWAFDRNITLHNSRHNPHQISKTIFARNTGGIYGSMQSI